MDTRYFLYDHQHPVDELHPEWQTALPVSRTGAQNNAFPSITYGDYFTAVSDFLLRDGGQSLMHGLSCQLDDPALPEVIGDIDILVQKHGAFYHPARVDVSVGRQTTSLVVNVAVSKAGRNVLPREYHLIGRLNQLFSKRWIPRVYHLAEGSFEKRSHPIPMFLGEWLSGFHEFHIHMGTSTPPAVHIWHPKHQFILNIRQEKELYRQIAEILTYYYNEYTFDQIFPWHHAAGDFVVQMQDRQPTVRLITVRGYAPMVDIEKEAGAKTYTKRAQAEAIDPLTLLDVLFRFFIHLSLRTRIDRIDGTGDLCWAKDHVLDATIQGFMDGLAAKDPLVGVGEGLDEGVALSDLMILYLSQLSNEDFEIGIHDTISAYPDHSPERQLMEVYQNDHAIALYQHITSTLPSPTA